MPVQSVSLFVKSVKDFRRTWPRLLAADLVCKVIAFMALTPLVGLTLKVLMPGDSQVLADQDILFFALSPAGLAALLVMGTVGLAILALEQACLMTIGFGQVHGRRVTVSEALWYGTRHAWPVVLLALRILVRCLLITLPFLAAGGLVYLLLLREYDINYYLAQRPPVFFFAAGAVATLLAVMAVLVIRRLLTWAYALPLLLFESRGPAEALAISEERTAGTRRRVVAGVLVAWGIAAALLSVVPLAVTGAVGRWMVPRFADSMAMMVIVIGGLLVFWGLINLAVTMINAAMFALLTVRLYDAHGSTPGSRPAGDVLPEAPAAGKGLSVTVNRAMGVLALFALLAAVAGFALVRNVRLDNEVVVIAHRGAAASAPENTLAAVALAVEQGADFVEIDVQESADGEVVVVHDSDLMRVGGSPLKIWETTYAELSRVDVGRWYGPEFSGQRVPTLEQVLEICRGRSMANIELKYYGHNQRLEQRVAGIVERMGMEDEVVLMSLVGDLVQSMKELRPDWTVGLLTARAVGDLTAVEADFLAVHTGIASARFVRRAHAAGKQVYVWTVNDKLNMSRMISRGVDGLITDHPALARQVIEERAEMNSAERLMLTAAFWLGLEPKEPPPETDL